MYETYSVTAVLLGGEISLAKQEGADHLIVPQCCKSLRIFCAEIVAEQLQYGHTADCYAFSSFNLKALTAFNFWVRPVSHCHGVAIGATCTSICSACTSRELCQVELHLGL